MKKKYGKSVAAYSIFGKDIVVDFGLNNRKPLSSS